MRHITIMDTTLRDGEQTSGVSFSEPEKLNIAKLLLSDVKVDSIEIASARVSDGEFASAVKVINWAKSQGVENKVEILGFIDKGESLNWIQRVGGKVVNLLTKGSLSHLTYQLKKTPEQHIEAIKAEIADAKKRGFTINIYLEDWSNGMRNSSSYVFQLLEALRNEPIKRFMLPDTLGILRPEEVYEFCRQVLNRFPELHFDFHAHNDYDLSVANVGGAIRAGIHGVHTTVNGLGERAGNAPLSSVIAIMNDHMKVASNVDERQLNNVSRIVESFSGIRIPPNMPIVGEYVFTQCSGVHADGDNKKQLYFNDLLPERFGRIRKYALGKTSGKANIAKNLKDMGIELDAEDLKKVTERVIQLADKKENVTVSDLPFIISDVLKNAEVENKIKLRNYAITHTYGLHPTAILSLEIDGVAYEESSPGDGQYDAFMNALRKIYSKFNRPFPMLVDYYVAIPPGGHTDALVETTITWRMGREFKTRGLDSDQTVAAIQATIKMLNILEQEFAVY